MRSRGHGLFVSRHLVQCIAVVKETSWDAISRRCNKCDSYLRGSVLFSSGWLRRCVLALNRACLPVGCPSHCLSLFLFLLLLLPSLFTRYCQDIPLLTRRLSYYSLMPSLSRNSCVLPAYIVYIACKDAASRYTRFGARKTRDIRRLVCCPGCRSTTLEG